jgi:hypothetical protein
MYFTSQEVILKKLGQTLITIMVVVCFTNSLPAMASDMGAPSHVTASQWSVSGSLGHTNYQNVFKSDGQTEIGRFAIQRNFNSNTQYIVAL